MKKNIQKYLFVLLFIINIIIYAPSNYALPETDGHGGGGYFTNSFKAHAQICTRKIWIFTFTGHKVDCIAGHSYCVIMPCTA